MCVVHCSSKGVSTLGRERACNSYTEVIAGIVHVLKITFPDKHTDMGGIGCTDI